MALRNVAWFDYDYWLTARISHRHGKPLPNALSADYVKRLVRRLNIGGTYAEFLQTQLVDAPLGAWRLNAHAKVNRARMDAELAKARYAGHLANDHNERSYRWVQQVLAHPHNALRPPVDGQRLIVRQITLHNESLQGVLLINSDARGEDGFVLYTPDAPDRRAWRSVPNTRALLRMIRKKPALLAYVIDRLPHSPADQTRRLILKGGLGTALRTPAVDDELFYAYYMAAVRGLMAIAKANSRTTGETDLQKAMTIGWRLLDLIGLAIPARVFIPLSLGRMAIEIWDGVQAYRKEDIDGVLQHVYNALSHLNDATTGFVATGVMRRMLRGVPAQPPLPLPSRYSVIPDVDNLRFRIDGIYGEGVYEQVSEFEGLTQYFIQDTQGRHYKVAFDGQRWRAIDPEQPDVYLQQPVKKRESGDWVIDSPVLWYDGLPDLENLLQQCLLAEPLSGEPIDGVDGLYQADEHLYLQTEGGQLPLRQHLLAGRFHLPIPNAHDAGVVPWAVLRWIDGQWQLRVRQAGRSSSWLALPSAYSVNRGNNRSRR